MKKKAQKNNKTAMSSETLTHAAAAWVRERHVSEVSRLFFSDLNVAALQDGLRYRVFKQTGRVIAPQSVADLVVTMRATYLSDGLNQPTRVVEQVRDLNGKVLDFVVRRIVAELEMRDAYRRDKSQEAYAHAAGRSVGSLNTSSKGERSLAGANRLM